MNAIRVPAHAVAEPSARRNCGIVTEVVANGDGRSRAQLMVQVCQPAVRPSGGLKVRE